MVSFFVVSRLIQFKNITININKNYFISYYNKNNIINDNKRNKKPII